MGCKLSSSTDMECTKCHKVLDIHQFSYKNVAKKIYYVHCDKCRETILKDKDKQKKEKEQYEFVKKTNVIECACGKKYIAFRDYHILRHNNTKTHIARMKNV